MIDIQYESKMRRSTFGDELGSLKRREETFDVKEKPSRLSEPVRFNDKKSFTVPKLHRESNDKENYNREVSHGHDLDITFAQKEFKVNESKPELLNPLKETNQKPSVNNPSKRFSHSCEKSYITSGLEQSITKRSKSDAHETLQESMSKKKIQLYNQKEEELEDIDKDYDIPEANQNLMELKNYSRHPSERASLMKEVPISSTKKIAQGSNFSIGKILIRVILLTIFLFLGASYYFKITAVPHSKPSSTNINTNGKKELESSRFSGETKFTYSNEREIPISEDGPSRDKEKMNKKALTIYKDIFSRLSKTTSGIRQEELKTEILDKYATEFETLWRLVQTYQVNYKEIDIEIDETTYDKVWVKK